MGGLGTRTSITGFNKILDVRLHAREPKFTGHEVKGLSCYENDQTICYHESNENEKSSKQSTRTDGSTPSLRPDNRAKKALAKGSDTAAETSRERH